MGERIMSFYKNRIDDAEKRLEYYSKQLVTSTSSSHYWYYSKQCQEARKEMEVWDEKAREEGIYIV